LSKENASLERGVQRK